MHYNIAIFGCILNSNHNAAGHRQVYFACLHKHKQRDKRAYCTQLILLFVSALYIFFFTPNKNDNKNMTTR